jgi:hypothetical protein
LSLVRVCRSYVVEEGAAVKQRVPDLRKPPFRVLTLTEVDALSPEERAEYAAKVSAWLTARYSTRPAPTQRSGVAPSRVTKKVTANLPAQEIYGDLLSLDCNAILAAVHRAIDVKGLDPRLKGVMWGELGTCLIVYLSLDARKRWTQKRKRREQPPNNDAVRRHTKPAQLRYQARQNPAKTTSLTSGI